MSKIGYVYMMTDKQGKLFVGATTDLKKRVWLHQHALYTLSRRKKQLAQLVYVERCATIVEALVKKTTLAKGKRDNKVALIREYNPERSDLTKERCGTGV